MKTSGSSSLLLNESRCKWLRPLGQNIQNGARLTIDVVYEMWTLHGKNLIGRSLLKYPAAIPLQTHIFLLGFPFYPCQMMMVIPPSRLWSAEELTNVWWDMSTWSLNVTPWSLCAVRKAPVNPLGVRRSLPQTITGDLCKGNKQLLASVCLSVMSTMF